MPGPSAEQIGRITRERRSRRESCPVGDEHAMLVHCPEGGDDCDPATDISACVGAFLRELSWGTQGTWADESDPDFWSSNWDRGGDAFETSEEVDDQWGARVGDLSSTIDLIGPTAVRVPGAPGFYCCDPDYAYDLWTGLYAREPEFWGKYNSVRTLPGYSGPVEMGAGAMGGGGREFKSKYEDQEGLAKHAYRAAVALAKVIQEAGYTATVNPPTPSAAMFVYSVSVPSLQVSDSEADLGVYRQLVDRAVALAGRHDVYVKFSYDNSGVYFLFSTLPSTVSALGYTPDSVAGAELLLGVITGNIPGIAIPMGDGTFGVVGPGVGNIFNKIKDSLSGGDKNERLAKKVKKLWSQILKLNSQLTQEGADAVEPWKTESAAPAAAAAGMAIVGRLPRGVRRANKFRKKTKAPRSAYRKSQRNQPEPQQSAHSWSREDEGEEEDDRDEGRGGRGGKGGKGKGGNRGQQQQPQIVYLPAPPQPQAPVPTYYPSPYGGYPPPGVNLPPGVRWTAGVGGVWSGQTCQDTWAGELDESLRASGPERDSFWR